MNGLQYAQCSQFSVARWLIIMIRILSQAAILVITPYPGFLGWRQQSSSMHFYVSTSSHAFPYNHTIILFLVTALAKSTVWTLGFSSLAYVVAIFVYVAKPHFHKARRFMERAFLYMKEAFLSVAAKSRLLFSIPIAGSTDWIRLKLLSASDMLGLTYLPHSANPHIPTQGINEVPTQAKPPSPDMGAVDVEGWVMVNVRKKNLYYFVNALTFNLYAWYVLAKPLTPS